MVKRKSLAIFAASAFALGLAALPVHAAQPVTNGPYGGLLPTVLYDVDYAVALGGTSYDVPNYTQTIVSLGLADKTAAGTNCAIQVAWYDWNGALVGLSGANGVSALTPGTTLEFTSSITGNPVEFDPYQENVFRDQGGDFEGHAEIREGGCSPVAIRALRADAEFVITNINSSGSPAFQYKPIVISKPTGVMGY